MVQWRSGKVYMNTSMCVLIAIILGTHCTLFAAEPPTTPFIRITSEMHTGRIQGAATDLEGRLLATISSDKTLKIWERKSGKLFRTIYPPIGNGHEGLLNAVALSPDGKTAATGGPTARTWDNSYVVYIFNVETGAMISRISGFSKSIYRLAYSRDGKRLAVGLGYGGGISVHSTTDWTRLFMDTSFKGQIRGMEFDSRGNLIATSDKGMIKRFKPDGSLDYSILSDTGKKISSIKISPDDSMIALGFDDNGSVQIIHAGDGSFYRSANDPKGAKFYPRFPTVAWSKEGGRLLAAGNHSNAWGSFRNIVTASSGSSELNSRVQLPVFGRITVLLTFEDGSTLFVSTTDGFGLLDADQKMVYFKSLAHASFPKNHDIFKINPAATAVMFSYERFGKAKASFDIMKKTLRTESVEDQNFMAPRFSGDGLDVRNWDGTTEPRLHRMTLGKVEEKKIRGLLSGETTYSLAVRHDSNGFILGTRQAIRSYDKDGRQRWMQQIPAIAWDVALSADDKTLVAALDDGTIRWYHADTGEETIALYLHPDRKRWIIWMPNGFFDHGPDSENLVGFHVNRGKDKEAMLVSVNQMYDTFYRPDIIDQAIKGKDITAYLKNLVKPSGVSAEIIRKEAAEKEQLANAKHQAEATRKSGMEMLAHEKAEQEHIARQKAELEPPARLASEKEQKDDQQELENRESADSIPPPEVAILMGALINSSTLPPKVRFISTSGTAKQRDIALVAELCDTGGGIGDVTLFLNDMPVAIENTSRGLQIHPKDSVKNCYNFERTITLQQGRNVITLMAYNRNNSIESERGRLELDNVTINAIKPQLHILTIAVNAYRDGDLRLKYAINDAEVLSRIIFEKASSIFSAVHTHKLHNDDVTREKLEAVFAEIGRKTKRDDVFLLFVAGHGITSERDGAYYFLPVDFRYTSDESISAQGVSMNDFKKYLVNIQAMKSLLLIDTCNSGSFSEAMASRGVTEKTAINKLTRAMGRATIVASSKNQSAMEGYEGHGVFSYTVLEGFKGKASNKKGEITVNLLANFIEETLPELTFKKWGYEQIPQKSLQGMDFPIGMR